MLDYLQPGRIIEAGSGWSTAVAKDEADENPAIAGLEVTCIEPYPAPRWKTRRETAGQPRSTGNVRREPACLALTQVQVAPGKGALSNARVPPACPDWLLPGAIIDHL